MVIVSLVIVLWLINRSSIDARSVPLRLLPPDRCAKVGMHRTLTAAPTTVLTRIGQVFTDGSVTVPRKLLILDWTCVAAILRRWSSVVLRILLVQDLCSSIRESENVLRRGPLQRVCATVSFLLLLEVLDVDLASFATLMKRSYELLGIGLVI